MTKLRAACTCRGFVFGSSQLTSPPTARQEAKQHRSVTLFSAEEKIRIVLEGLRGEQSIAELCRKEGIAQNLYYRWSEEFLEAGKKRLAGDRGRTSPSR
jgi:transposase